MITFEAKIREQTVRMYSDLPLKNAVGAIFRTLAQVSQKVNIFNNKFVLCFGWAYFFLDERRDEKGEKFWVVQTGDYNKDPQTDRVDNATTSLVVQNMQIEAVQIAKVKPESTTCKDTVLVLKEAKDAEDVYMNRSEAAKDGDSGWYFGLLDDPNEENHSADDYERIPSYEFLKLRTDALRVLQMPVGTVAVFHNNELTALIDSEDKPLKFTTDEERRKLSEKQRAEFEAQVKEAQARAQAEAAGADNSNQNKEE